MIGWFLIACLPDPGSVTLTGRVLSTQYGDDGAPNVTIESFDSELEPYAEAATGANGEFSVEVMASRVYHLHLTGDGIVPTAFSGIVGQQDVSLEDGDLYVRTEEEVAALRALHDQCPSAEEEGGIIEGVVEFPLISDASGEAVVAESAEVSAALNDATSYAACVLDDDGLSVADPGQVGVTGRFAIFGVAPGAVTVEFQQPIGDKTLSNYGFALLPEGGIAPFHPAIIDLPQ